MHSTVHSINTVNKPAWDLDIFECSPSFPFRQFSAAINAHRSPGSTAQSQLKHFTLLEHSFHSCLQIYNLKPVHFERLSIDHFSLCWVWSCAVDAISSYIMGPCI